MVRRKRPFESLEPDEVKLYVCGPTVYSNPHIGNFRSFIMGDILRRWLEYRGYNVFLTMNITDIDDKTIRDSGKEGVPLNEFTERYTKSFLRGIDLLNIRRATVYPRATEYIPRMIKFIEALVNKNAAYEAEDGVYFDINSFPDYGKLSGIDLEKIETTERLSADEYDKESVHDFALWKKSTQDELDRGIYSDSPWGPGRPGWHIECSAMTKSIMGDTIDIHAGGEDLVFPHHENEIAQSETLTGKKFVRYWFHIRHLMINGKKMSKSLGNFVTFEDVISNYSADAFRYFYLTTHYRRPLDYTDTSMNNAQNSVNRLENTLDLMEEVMKGADHNLDYEEAEERILEEIMKQKKLFEEAMDDDLDTHRALDALHVISGEINSYIAGEPNKGVLFKAGQIYRELLKVLGLFETQRKEVDGLTEDLITMIIELRENLREEKKYELADEIRDKLREIGIEISDTPQGTGWTIKR
jgi:cysteinyl-tRNA synthetase